MAKLTDKEVHSRYRFYEDSVKGMKENLDRISKKIIGYSFFVPVPMEEAILAEKEVIELHKCRITVLEHLKIAEKSRDKWEADKRNIRYCKKLFKNGRKRNGTSTEKN